MRIKKGDTVQITVGKDRGKTGKVASVNPKNDTLIIEGLNVYKKHRRPKRQGEKGEVISVNRPFSTAKALLYCNKCKRGVRVGNHRDGKKTTRICRRCETTI